MRLNRGFLPAALLILLFSCSGDPSRVFVADVESRGWERDLPRYLYIDSRDTVTSCNLSMIVRLTPAFVWDGLSLSVETLSPDNMVWRDTVTIAVPAVNGASAKGNRDIEVPFRNSVVFGREGIYRLAVRHIMPVGELKGVAGVGFVVKQ